MSQSSRGYSADDLEEEPSLTPSGAEERGSDSLRSPAFQEAAVEPGPPPMPEPVQRDFGTPMAGALGNFEAGPAQEAPAAPDIAHPARELSGNSSPEIGQAIQNLGQGPEPLAMPRAGSGFEDAWIHETERRQRESERQQSGIHAYLASKGVQTQILPDGTHAIATDETGAPLWKAAVSAPYQDPETGRWLVKSRDQRGVLQDVDLLSTKGIVHTDQKTAARYIIGQNKQSIDLNSPDPAVISRNQTAAVRSDLYAREQLANQQVAKIQAGMADAQATVRTMDAMNGAPPVLGSRPKSVAALKNFIKTNTQGMKAGILTEDQQAEYKDAQANLERHYQDFPEHRLAEDAVTGAKAQIAQIKQAYLEDRDRRLALRLNPHSTAATAALLPTVQGNAAPGTVEAAQVDQDTAQAAAQGRTTLSLAMPGVLQRMKASGVQFVGKGDQQRPIDEAIRDALNPDALNPPKRQPLAPAPAPKAPGPSATKNFFGTLINSFGTLINSFAITGDEIGEAVGRSLSYMSGGTMGGDLIKGALMGPAAGDAINPGLRTLGEGITHDTQEDIRYRDELQTGKYTPGNPYAPTAPGNTLGEAMVNPKRTGDFATGVAKAVPEVGLLALNPMAAIGTMTGVGAMKGGDKAVSDAITHGDANPEDARMGAMAKSGGTSALIAAFYALTGGVVGKVMPAVANPLARALTAAGITAPVLAAVDAGATKLAGGNAIPQTPDEWGERLAMLVFFTGHAGFGEYGRPKQVEQVLNAAQTAPERIQLAKAQIAALNGARPLVEGQGDEVTLAKLNAYQAAAQKFLDAQNPKLVEKIRVRMQQAAEAAKAASQTDAGTPPPGQSAPLGEVPPPSEDDEGGSGISSGKEPAPHSPAGQAKAFSETLKAKDELAPKIKAAQDAGTVSAPLLAENDVHGADAHQVEQRATSEIPEGIRNRIAAVLGADGPANEAHFAQDPDHGFAAAHVGKELRDTYTTPEQQAALERIGQGLGDKAPVAEYVADQHVGMLAGRDLLAIATGRGEVAPERLAELGRLGLVEPGADGTPHVTHDALPLLPNNLTAKLVTAHDRFRVLSLHGEKLEGAAAMVRNGQGQLETALHARATAAREQASAKPYHVRVEFTDHKGEAQERVIRGKFHNDEQALAHALTVAEKRGMKVTDAKVSTPEKEAARKRQSSSAPVPAGESSSEHTDPLEARKNVFTKVDAKTFEPEQRGAIRTVMQFLRQNRAELKAIGIDPEPEFGRNSRDSSGLAVTSGGKLLLDGKQLREHFDALGSREKALEWVKAAVIEEEGLHRHQFLATEKAGLDFKEHYDAIRKEAPADMVQHARETYEGFEQLAPHEQGAELERMVLQQKWHGSLTERMFKSIERILAYLKGLKIQSPLLKESIARVEAVRDEALKRANEARDEVPKARDTGASPPPESPSGAPAAREGSRVPLFASKAKPEEPLIRESRLNGLHNLAATGADDVGAKARFYGSTPEEVAYVESLVAQTHGKADNMFFTAARTKKARAAAQKVRDSLGKDTLPSDESRPQRPESSAVHWSMESRGQHAEKPSGRGIGDEGFSGDSALLEHASAAEDGSAGRLEQGALFASKATADPVAPRKEAAPDDTGALQSSKALTALHDKIAEKLIPAKQELRAAGSKREIAQDYDAAETGANIGGDQAGNMIRLDFARPKPANESPGQRKAREAAQTADREAMPYVIENGIKPLAQQRADVLASSDPKLIKSELPKVDRAIANFTRLDKLRFNHDRLMGLSMRQLKGAGVSVGEVQDYITRKLELPDATKDAEPSPMFPMGNGAAGSPRYFTKGRSFATLSEAVRAGYKPVSTDIAKLDQHRIEAGRKMIEQRQFFEKLKKTPSPTDGKPIIGEMIQRPLANGETEATVPHGYTTVTMAGRPFVVHKQFADLFSNLFGQSAIRSTIAGRALLKLAAAGKHGTLVFDTFHVGRLLYKMASGIGNLSTAVGEGSPIKMRDGKPSFGYHAGRTLLEYSDSDLGRAQAAGDITAKEAAFARKYRAQFDELVKSGLNIGKVSDNLMEQAGLHIPGVSTANKWIFGKLSRGAMAQTALKFYDRNLSRSGMSREQAARRTATEMNEYFGNLQNQGIFKSKTLQDVARLVFLAPNWTESQFRYEARAYGQIGASVVDLARGKGLRAGNATRAMAAGFVGLLAANQVANYLSRGQSTFQNEEDGHKLDAWVPGGKRGFWFNPFEIAGEYAHAAMKYAAQHENPVDIATHIASNKLSPLGRGVKEAATGRDSSGRHFLNDTDRFRGAAVDALPSPMPLGGFFEKDPRSPTGYRITRAPGAFQKQLMQSAGAKVTAAQSPRTQMFAIAHDFRPDGQYVDSAGEYTELRRALDNDQPDAAQSEVQWLLGRGKTLKQIGEALGIKAGGISKEQFTGGAEREQSMLATLTPEQRKVYDQAQRDHVENAKKFRALVTTPEFQQSVAGAKTPAVDKSATSEFDQLPLPQAIDRFKKSMNDPAISPETRRQWRAILQRKHAQVGQLKAA